MQLFMLAMSCIMMMTFTQCKKEETRFPDEIDQTLTGINQLFDQFDTEIGLFIEQPFVQNQDSALIRSQLKGLVEDFSWVEAIAWIDENKILQQVEPDVYYSQQGSDLSQYDLLNQLFSAREPLMGSLTANPGGFQASEMLYPVLKNNQVAGCIKASVIPYTPLETVILPLLENHEFEIWVMQKGGTMIFDEDTEVIGLNIFTDPYYDGFDNLKVAAAKIDEGDQGETSYSFYKAGTYDVITKQAFWKTWEIYGMEWKIVWVKEI
jgi:hypothetical protein